MSYTYEYPRPAVATDCVVFGFDGRELQILLIERGNEPYKGYWAFPGDFMNMDESAEQCALRELQEETGLTINMLKQLGAFTDVHRDPRGRVVSIAFYALVRPTEVKGGDDASEARWFAIDDVPRLAFDHDYILRKAMQQMRKDIHFEPIGFELLNKSFTMPELQLLYEAILGVRFDRRNFEKKMLQTGILQVVEDEEYGEELFEHLLKTPAYSTKFFGERKEMQTKEIDELFGGDSKKNKTSGSQTLFDPYWNSRIVSAPPEPIKPLHNAVPSVENHADEEYVELSQPRKPGRKGRRFSFNKEKYNRLKQDHNFKLEF